MRIPNRKQARRIIDLKDKKSKLLLELRKVNKDIKNLTNMLIIEIAGGITDEKRNNSTFR